MTVGELYELLDRLPYACDDFKVRFTTRDRSTYVEPETWDIDDADDFIWKDDYDGVPYTVYNMKRLLADEDDEYSFTKKTHVYYYDWNEERHYSPQFARCAINWKRERVDVWMD